MDFCKIIKIVTLCLFIYSCDSVSKKEHDELVTKYELLQEASKSTDVKVVQQYKDINTIFEKIQAVSGNLILARKNIEGMDYSQVEKINIHIGSISNELTNLRKSANEKTNPELFKTIKHLQSVILGKQKEIDLLKEDIQKKDNEIYHQGLTIEEQVKEIDLQRQKIDDQKSKIEKQQAQQWYDMGIILYNISGQYETGSKGFFGIHKGNYNKIKENKKTILLEAKKCFNEADRMGITSANQYISKINSEIQNL